MVRNCAKRMKADNVYNSILVVQRALTAPAKAAINEINSYFHMEVFEVNIILFCFVHDNCLAY